VLLLTLTSFMIYRIRLYMSELFGCYLSFKPVGCRSIHDFCLAGLFGFLYN